MSLDTDPDVGDAMDLYQRFLAKALKVHKVHVHLIKDWEDQPRDSDGRWGSGGGTAVSDVPRDPGLPADHSSGRVAEAVNGGAVLRADPDQMTQLVHEWAQGDKPVQLMGMTVNGKENANLFSHPVVGISRVEMPRVPNNAADTKAFAEHLEANGIKYKEEDVDPRTLRPTQGEIDGRKVGSIAQAMRDGTMRTVGQTLVVSKDGDILDGHHRWAAACIRAIDDPSTTVHVLRVDTDIHTLLATTHEFNAVEGIKPSAFGKKADPPPPNPNEPWLRVGGHWILLANDTADGVPEEGYGLPLAKPRQD